MTMLGLVLLITLCFDVQFSNGQTDPVFTCIGGDGLEYDPPCIANEDEGILYVKVTVPNSLGFIPEIITQDATTTTNSAYSLAAGGKDYIPVYDPLSGARFFSFPYNYMIPIVILNDSEEEPTEEFVISAYFFNLSPPGDRIPCTSCQAVIQVVDDDDRPRVTLDRSIYSTDEGSELIVGVTRSTNGETSPISVSLSSRDISATSDDYTFEPMAMIEVSEAGFLRIQTTSDSNDDEGSETFEISIDASDSYLLGSPSSAIVLIQDRTPTFEIEYSDYQANENQTPFTFNIKRSSTETSATISYSTRDISATAGADYESVSGGIATFPATVDTAQGSVNILQDLSNEGPEIFEILLTGPSTGNLGSNSKATVTLFDASSSQSRFFLDRFLYCQLESSTTVDIIIRRENDVSQRGSVEMYSSDIDATKGTDYMSIDKRIDFGPNEIEKTERLTIIDDNLVEVVESLQLTLTQPIGGVIGFPGVAVVEIKDNDYCYSFAYSYYSVAESEEQVNLQINKMGYLRDDSTSVNFFLIERTARENDDYRLSTTTAQFPTDLSSANVPVFTLVQDGEYENDEEFDVKLHDADPNRICEPSTTNIIIKGSDSMCNPACMNGGFCIAPNLCECAPGFTGPTCSQSQCEVPCSNEGVCIAPNTCTCPSNFRGPTCGQVVCPENYCQNGGTCESTATSYSCQCRDGFEGTQCENTRGLTAGAIVGIVVGVLAGVLIIGATVVLCVMAQQRISNPNPSQIQLGKDGTQDVNPGILTDGSMMTYPFYGR